MKPNTPFTSSCFQFPHCFGRSRLTSLLIAALCFTTVAVLWAQSRRVPATLDDLTLREFSDLAILEPVAMTALLEKSQTTEDRADAARARLAINDPAAHAALYAPLVGERLAAHEKAVHDFTHPFEVGADLLEKRKDAAYRHAEAEALRTIRNPVFPEQE